MNKVKIGATLILACLVLLIIGSVILPIKYDAIIDSTNFKKNISELYIADLDKLVRSELGKEYDISSTIDDIAKTIEWNDKTISCNAFFTIHGKVMSDVVIIHFKGTKYWYKKYNWQIVK